MILSFGYILSVNIDDSTTNGAGRVDDQNVILVDPECTQFGLVDSTLIDSLSG